MTDKQINYVGLLNERAQKKGWTVYYELQTDGPEHIKSFTMVAIMNGKKYPKGCGRNKKEAKQNAAQNALNSFENDESANSVPDENGNMEESIEEVNTSLQDLDLSTSTDTDTTATTGRNFIGLLNEYCQRTQQFLLFEPLARTGPAHNPKFEYRVVINSKKYPEAEGKSKQEARQIAAEKAWNEIRDSDINIRDSSPSLMSETPDSCQQKHITSTPSNSKSESIVFASPVSDVKPKRQLAANFQNSPVNNKKKSNINALQTPKPLTSSTASTTTKSRFLEEFDRDSIRKIGKGGQGHVFKARRKLEDTLFAVKIVKFTERSRREITALSDLEHTNIVRYYTSWTEDTEYRDDTTDTYSSSTSDGGSEFLYIQMEFCDGETLHRWIDYKNKHPEQCPERRPKAADIIKQVLEAVKYIHSKGLIHRDLKPANILFGHKGGVKVGDFGLVTKDEGEDGGILMERSREAGTRSYMSPEQTKKNYDRKVDIYPMGLIYFELLWRFGTRQERLNEWQKIRKKNFPADFSINFDFEHKLIEGMMSEKPEQRPEARDLLIELNRHMATTASDERKLYKRNRTY